MEVSKTERIKVEQTRSATHGLETRAEDGGLTIEGYFAVFGWETELWPGAFEEIAPTAFDNTLSGDIRALINHDTSLVLGRTKAGTLALKVDARGLWGSIKINEKDTDAMNLYERVRRGDVTQCSFGFDIVSEETQYLDNGTVRWIINEVKLYEVSCCTFPAYEETGIQARKNDIAQHERRKLDEWKQKARARLDAKTGDA